jgi:hypothetical protein
MVPAAHCLCATEQPAVAVARVVGLEVPYWRGTPGRLSREPSAGHNIACVHLPTRRATRGSALCFETHGPAKPRAMRAPNSAAAVVDTGAGADSDAEQWATGAARTCCPQLHNRGRLSATCSSAQLHHAAIPEVLVYHNQPKQLEQQTADVYQRSLLRLEGTVRIAPLTGRPRTSRYWEHDAAATLPSHTKGRGCLWRSPGSAKGFGRHSCTANWW